MFSMWPPLRRTAFTGWCSRTDGTFYQVMNFDVVFLGTGAAVPVPSRGTTSQFLDIHGHTYLIDAGEGVQISLRRNKCKFQKLKGIFVSHMHGDHVLGLPGLLSTMSLLGRKEPLTIYGPADLKEWMEQTWRAIQAHLSFELTWLSWDAKVPQDLWVEERYRLISFPVKHRIPTCGLRVEERSLPWGLDGVKAGVAQLPYHVRQALKRGEEIEWENKLLQPGDWCTPPRKARAYVFSADTRPCQSLQEMAKGADVLYHDSTFANLDEDRAKSTYHSTASQAGRLARQAGVGHLVLGHISTRYRDMDLLLEEAKAFHPHVTVSKDDMRMTIEGGGLNERV